MIDNQNIKDDTLAGRVETGALKINADWKGFYIRGDDCAELQSLLRKIIDNRFLDTFDMDVVKRYYYLMNDVFKK